MRTLLHDYPFVENAELRWRLSGTMGAFPRALNGGLPHSSLSVISNQFTGAIERIKEVAKRIVSHYGLKPLLPVDCTG